MKPTPIPEDIALIAKARGLKLLKKDGAFVLFDGRKIRLTTASASEVRSWLAGTASVMVTK